MRSKPWFKLQSGELWFNMQKRSSTMSRRPRGSGKRELINTGKTKRYVRRDGKGQFRQSVSVGRSLSADRRGRARTKVAKGYGDQGDR